MEKKNRKPLWKYAFFVKGSQNIMQIMMMIYSALNSAKERIDGILYDNAPLKTMKTAR